MIGPPVPFLVFWRKNHDFSDWPPLPLQGIGREWEWEWEFTGNGKHATIPGPFANAIARMAKQVTTAGAGNAYGNRRVPLIPVPFGKGSHSRVNVDKIIFLNDFSTFLSTLRRADLVNHTCSRGHHGHFVTYYSNVEKSKSMQDSVSSSRHPTPNLCHQY